jgi:hypothetical protein
MLLNLSSLARVVFLLEVVAWFIVAPRTFGQRPNATPTVLTGPSDWRFERLPIPPGFAPDIRWTGFEEARFAPGMFAPGSTNYFTYVLAITVDGTAPVTVVDLKEFLEKYYRGLSVNVGRRKGLMPDVAQISAAVTVAKAETETAGKFEATIPYFDTFNDGRKILLHVEIVVLRKAAAKQTRLVMLISPQPTAAPVWKQLRSIGRTAEEK